MDKRLRRTFRSPDMAPCLPPRRPASLTLFLPPNPPAVPSVFIPVCTAQCRAPSSLQTVPSAWNVHSPLRAWLLPPVSHWTQVFTLTSPQGSLSHPH